MSDGEDRIATLLAALWMRNLPVVEERLAMLERTAAAAESCSLNADLLSQAKTGAHKLAGSLGMYGCDAGTRFAHEIEELLEGENFDSACLRGLVVELRNAIFAHA